MTTNTPVPSGRRFLGGIGRGLAVGLGVGAGLVVAIALLFAAIPNLFGTTEVERDHAVVLADLQDLSRFVAATGRYQTILDIEEDADYLPDFIKGQRVIYVAEGDVDGFVEFGELAEDAISVSEDGSTVTIRLPAPQLTEADLDAERSYIAARDRGLLDRLGDAVGSGTPEDESQLAGRAEDRIEEAAAASDLLDVARRNTESFLTGMMRAAGFERVIVIFEDQTP